MLHYLSASNTITHHLALLLFFCRKLLFSCSFFACLRFIFLLGKMKKNADHHFFVHISYLFTRTSILPVLRITGSHWEIINASFRGSNCRLKLYLTSKLSWVIQSRHLLVQWKTNDWISLNCRLHLLVGWLCFMT